MKVRSLTLKKEQIHKSPIRLFLYYSQFGVVVRLWNLMVSVPEHFYYPYNFS